MNEEENKKKHTFDTMRNGYNRFQVDDCVLSLELQMESLQKQLEKAYQLKELHVREAQDIRNQYDALNKELSLKEKAAYDMTRLAMREANVIVDTAHQNADIIVREALMMARAVLSEIARLGIEAKDRKGTMQEELQKIAEALQEFETPQIPDMDLLKKD